MSNWIVVLLLLGSLTVLGQNNTTIPLPADPATPVLIMNFHGADRSAGDPFLVIRADGRVTVTSQSHYGTPPPVHGRLTGAELQELLRFVIDDQHFFQFDRDAVLRGLPPSATSGWMCCPATTSIHVRTRDQVRLNEFTMAQQCATSFPSIKQLTEFAAIQTRLQVIADIVAAGGQEAVQKALDSANQYVRSHPDLPQLTIDDFAVGNNAPDGRKSFTFGRDLSNTKRLTLRVGYVSATKTEVTSEIHNTDDPLLEFLRSKLPPVVCTSVR